MNAEAEEEEEEEELGRATGGVPRAATCIVPPAESPITSGCSAADALVGGSAKAPRVVAIASYDSVCVPACAHEA